MMPTIGDMLAASDPIGHIADRPWTATPRLLGGHVLSSQIATMILVGVVVAAGVLAAARRRAMQPKGKGYNLIEVLVIFARDGIARPALHEKCYTFLPFLLTLFLFVLACNLAGLVPLVDISAAVPVLRDYPIGGTPTGSIWVTGALAGMAFLVIVGGGVAEQVRRYVHRGRPAAVGWTIGFFLYLWSLVPSMPVPIKIAMSVILIPLEFLGVLAKCFALAIRLFANMSAGHILLAVLLIFIGMARQAGPVAWVVTPASILGSVAFSLLELLVAVLQAYIFTFLTAMFLGMAANPHH